MTKYLFATVLLAFLLLLYPVHAQTHPEGFIGKEAPKPLSKLENPSHATYEPLSVIPITPQDYVRQELNKLGRPGDFGFVDFIFSRESGWCVHKWEGDIGYCPTSYRDVWGVSNSGKGYGLCQSTPAIKMANAGGDYLESALTQFRWCDAYAQARYGGWANAYNYWIGHGNW